MVGTTDDSKPIEVQTEVVEPAESKAKDESMKHPAQFSSEDYSKVKLSWKTWVVVFISCFSVTAQIFVVGGATSVIAFIIRDVGDASNSTWIIQGPLLMQSVLSPIVGRLSDVLDRKWMATIPPFIAAGGAVMCALSTDMNMLIGGSILIGTTLATIAIVHAIPSEVLPMKYRAVANGLGFLGGTAGGLTAKLASGAVTNVNPSGWRYIFWIQFAFHMITGIGFLIFYWPKPNPNRKIMSFREIVWAIDPIGSVLFIICTTLMLMSLNWGGSRYPWDSAEVVAPLTVGCVFLLLFCLYEWKGRNDGIIAHVFFQNGPNFALSVSAFAVEGWVYYSAVNAITPQLVLNLGFENNSWGESYVRRKRKALAAFLLKSRHIGVRQMSFQVTVILASLPIIWYATRYKDMKWPLLITFGFFLLVCILYCFISPEWSTVQYVFNVICGIGQAGPLSLIVAVVQFTCPHAYLSTATGVAFTARAVGGAFGAAVLTSIVNGHLASNYTANVGAAATAAGLPESQVAALAAGIRAGSRTLMDTIDGLTAEILAEATRASQWTYARAYRKAWASIIPFTVLALVCVWFLKGVKELMTERVEATVEKVKTEDNVVKKVDDEP